LVIQEDAPATASVRQSPPVSQPGGAGSFDAFFVVEFPRMVAFATALVGDRAVAEELAQEAMLQAYRNWATVAGYDRPGAWVRRVTANLASSTRKRRGVEARALAVRITTLDARGHVLQRARAEGASGLVIYRG
jgi:DNA-directed RNA polymerase specialized sigma24 family protein